MNPERANRRTAIITSAIAVLLIIAIATLTRGPANDNVANRASTFFTDDSGTRAVIWSFSASFRRPGSGVYR